MQPKKHLLLCKVNQNVCFFCLYSNIYMYVCTKSQYKTTHSVTNTNSTHEGTETCTEQWKDLYADQDILASLCCDKCTQVIQESSRYFFLIAINCINDANKTPFQTQTKLVHPYLHHCAAHVCQTERLYLAFDLINLCQQWPQPPHMAAGNKWLCSSCREIIVINE